MRSVALALMLLLGVQAQAGAQDPNLADKLCTVPKPPKGVFQYTIDLIDGSTQGKNRYKVEDEVEIVFTNKNPFLFDYRFKIEEETLPEPDLTTFFRLFNTSPSAALIAAIPSTAAPRGVSESSEQIPLKCKVALAAKVKELTDQEDEILKTQAALKTLSEEIAKSFDALKGEIDAQEKKLQDAATACRPLVEAASAIVAAVDRRFGAGAQDNLGEKVTQFEKGVEALAKSIEQQASSIESARKALKEADCSPLVIKEKIGGFETILELLEKNLDSVDPKGLRKTLADFQAAAKAAKDKAKGISEVLLREQNFRETRQVGNYDEVTIVTITVDRKKKSETTFPSSAYLVKKLRFGGRQRFALAAGAAFSPLDQVQHGIVQGLELNAQGDVVLIDNMPNFTRVVGISEDSGQRVSPLILLHTRLFEGSSWNSGYHFSFGFAGNTANNGLELEYLIGPSISFAEERFFLTFGLYNGRTEELRQGFFIGKPVPALITSAPVVKGRDWDFGFAASFKFR